MKILADFNLVELQNFVQLIGLPKFRADQIYSAVLQAKDYEQLAQLPKAIKESLKKEYVLKPVNIENVFTAKDGTKKYLLKTYDGNIVESVFLKQDYGNTICLSTQIGCKMGCKFCASTVGGFLRNLSCGEMISIIAAINADNGECTDRNFSNIVLMGSGEPLDNYDEVIKFIRQISGKTNFNVSQRNISLSTCGLVENIYRLADEKLNITLCISLHAGDDDTRKTIMPIANRYSISEIIKAVKHYIKKTKRRVMIEYCLIKNINDSFEDCEKLSKLFKGMLVHINVINLNEKDENLKSVTKQQAYAFVDRLNKLGLSATLRRSQGSDIGGACGQLKNAFKKHNN